MKTKIILIFALIVTLTGYGQDKGKFDTQLNTVVKLFTTKNADVINPVLAENYTIAGIFPGAEEQVLPQVLPQLPRFDDYKLVSQSEEKEGTRVNVLLTESKSGYEYPANFLFNKEKKIQEFNILETASIQTQINGK
ncbi:hypothetical protein [Flavobacterium sp. AG291]|uniref:hypothetical protein n=1 Tax=Flavobacterium sp. AG291 TaxID=2184000 RepID=UPI000E0B7AD1|nr:hypothetical protein [Flavobacterium sp. AG291]RDI14599.1 hypothetical protein DEU42_102296 [Flavobacterium sp. AG291]